MNNYEATNEKKNNNKTLPLKAGSSVCFSHVLHCPAGAVAVVQLADLLVSGVGLREGGALCS